MKKKRYRAVLSVKGLSILSRGFKILDDVSWRVERGENWVILGANGSGKTSLLAALTGYLAPTLGEIELLGMRYGAADWRALRTRVGIVTSAIHPLMMSGEEPALKTVASGRFAMLGFWGDMKAEDERKARRILKLHRMRQARGPRVARALAGRAPESAHRARPDGEPGAAHSRRAVCAGSTPPPESISCSS